MIDVNSVIGNLFYHFSYYYGVSYFSKVEILSKNDWAGILGTMVGLYSKLNSEMHFTSLDDLVKRYEILKNSTKNSWLLRDDLFKAIEEEIKSGKIPKEIKNQLSEIKNKLYYIDSLL